MTSGARDGDRPSSDPADTPGTEDPLTPGELDPSRFVGEPPAGDEDPRGFSSGDQSAQRPDPTGSTGPDGPDGPADDSPTTQEDA